MCAALCAPFILAGCAALAVGTLQGPVQAFPAVNELLDRGGEAGDVIVNLHAQLNMLGGLMVILDRSDARDAARRRCRLGAGPGAPRVALRPCGYRAVLRRRRRVLGRGGAPRRGRRDVRGRSGGGRALGSRGARAGRARGVGRVLGLRACGLGDDGVASGRPAARQFARRRRGTAARSRAGCGAAAPPRSRATSFRSR